MSDWRAPSPADVPAWVELLAAIEAVDRTGEVLLAADLEDLLGLSAFDPARDARLVWDGGEPIAFATVLDAATGPPRRIMLDGAVRPDRRGRGLGADVLAWAVARGEARAAERPVAGEGWLEVGSGAGDVERERLFEATGFAPIRYYFQMRRSLDEPVPAPVLPSDLVLARFDPVRDEEVRAAHNEAFRDHWGSSAIDVEAWRAWVTGHHDFRPDCSFLVLDGPEIAGYALNALHPADWPGLGVREGWTHQLGVRRPWRGQGVARALLHATMRAFVAEGMELATLDVDAENPTGALALYERVGYRPHRRRVAWARALPPRG